MHIGISLPVPYTGLSRTILLPVKGTAFTTGAPVSISWQARVADELTIRNGPALAVGSWSLGRSVLLLGESEGRQRYHNSRRMVPGFVWMSI